MLPVRKGEKVDELVKSIKNSTYPHIEIIVVDEGFERSIQRNYGMARAKGEFILFLDSDQYPHPNLIADCRRLMFHYDAIYIPEVIITKGFFGYLRNWERKFYLATPIDIVKFIRNKDLVWFDPLQRGPEDSDFDRRIKGVRTISQYPLYHNDNVSMIDYFKKKIYYSQSMVRYAQRHKGDKVLNFWWRCFGVFFEEGKWRIAIRRPDLLILVWLMLFVRGIIYAYIISSKR